MADYRHQIKPNLSRSNGGSVARSASYILRDELHDERTGQTFDYSGKKDKALFTGIYAPKDAPEWAHDPEKLCNEIERAERYKNAQLARPVELSLPHELTLEQNKWLMQDYIKENYTRHGYAVIAAIHAPPQGGDERNIHAHLLVTLRTIDENGFSKDKSQEQENYRQKGPYTKARRESWEKHLKHQLKRHGFEKEAEAVSCKSLEAQGIEREPQQHLGPTASDMERKGKQTERGAINHEVEAQNRQREQLKAAEKELSQAIEKAQRQLDKETKEKQAEAERRARKQEFFKERNAKIVEGIHKTWTSTPRDAIAFMIALNERGLYVAQDEKGHYAAVEKNGCAHLLPDKDMQEAIDAMRRENSGLIIPTLDQVKDEREQEELRRMASRGATLYSHASMPSQQRDALIHIRDVHRQQKIARQREKRKLQPRPQEAKRQIEVEQQRQEAARQRREKEAERLRQQETERQRREKAASAKPESRDEAMEKREHRQASKEQTEYQRQRAQREALREQCGIRKQGMRERDDGGGRERER